MSAMKINPSQYRQLFLDDGAVEGVTGLRRVLHQPTRCGPVLRPTGESYALQAWNPPHWNQDKGLWEWWYTGFYTVPPHGKHQSTSKTLVQYACSSDGIHWDTPNLGEYRFRGSNENNIVVDPEYAPLFLYHMIEDRSDPDPERRYKALFGPHDRQPAISPDGKRWTFLEVPPIPSSDTSHLMFDEQTGQFLATVKMGTQWGRSVALSVSKDFEHWSEPELILHTDPLDCENRVRRIQEVVRDPAYLSPPLVDGGDYQAEIYLMPILPYQGVYVGLPVIFNPAGTIPPPHNNFTALNQIELATSRDLYNWTRVADRELFLGVVPWDGVAYDTACTYPCGPPIVRDDEIWIYYTANRFRASNINLYGDRYRPFFKDKSALNLAKLRLDGFVSLDSETSGSVVTKPFELSRELKPPCFNVNVQVKDNGALLTAELLHGRDLTPVSPYTSENCIPVKGDHLAARVRWRAENAPDLPETVRLRFILSGPVSLYSFWLE